MEAWISEAIFFENEPICFIACQWQWPKGEE